MSEIQRTGSATWSGDLKSGKGSTSSGGGGIRDLNYSFQSRFEQGAGTNPEEMIAAAHASCFSMALANMLAEGGHPAHRIDTKATLSMRREGAGFKISKVHLHTEAHVPGLSEADFKSTAEKAKDGCPVSTLVKPGLEALTLDARLI